MILTKKFFDRPTLTVARGLIGAYLVRRFGRKTRRFLITEVEAYDGFKDLASHASRGKTPRNEVMFGEAGRFYIYFVYGNHWMLNIVTGRKGYPAAILLRGLENVSGPGRLTRALKIGRGFNGKIAVPKTGLWFEKGIVIFSGKIKRTPRVGVRYAGPVWASKKYRFVAQSR